VSNAGRSQQNAMPLNTLLASGCCPIKPTKSIQYSEHLYVFQPHVSLIQLNAIAFPFNAVPMSGIGCHNAPHCVKSIGSDNALDQMLEETMLA
jgi:hypothetical protein